MQSPELATNASLQAAGTGRRGTVRRKQLDLTLLDGGGSPASTPPSVPQSLGSQTQQPAVASSAKLNTLHAAHHASAASRQVGPAKLAVTVTAASPRGSNDTPAPAASVSPVTIQCTQPTLPRPTSSPPASPPRDQPQPSLLSGAQRCASPTPTERGNSFYNGPQPSHSPSSPQSPSFCSSLNVSPTKLAALQNQSLRTGSQASMAPSIAPPRHFSGASTTRHERTESNGSGMSVGTQISVQGSVMTVPYSPSSSMVSGASVMRSPNHGGGSGRQYAHLHLGTGQGSSTATGAMLGAAKRWFQETKAFFEDGADPSFADPYNKQLLVNRSNDLSIASGLATRTTKLSTDLDFYKRELKRVQGERDRLAAQVTETTSTTAAASAPAPVPPRVAMWEAQAVAARELSLRTKLAAAERIAATAADAVKHDHVAKVQGMAGDLAAHVARTYMLEHQLQWFGVTPVTVAHPEYVVDHVPDEWIQANERRRKLEEVKATVEHEYAEWLVDAHEAEARVVGKMNEVRAAVVDWVEKKSGKGVKLSEMRKALKDKVDRAKEVERKGREVVQSLGKALNEETPTAAENGEEAEGKQEGAEGGGRAEKQMSMEEMIKAATLVRKKQEEDKKKSKAEQVERAKAEEGVTKEQSSTPPLTAATFSTASSAKTKAGALGLIEQNNETDLGDRRVKQMDSGVAPSEVPSSSFGPETNRNLTSALLSMSAVEPVADTGPLAETPVPTPLAKASVKPKQAWTESVPTTSVAPASTSKLLPDTPKTPIASMAAQPFTSEAMATAAGAAAPSSPPPPLDHGQAIDIPRPFDVSIGSVTAAILGPLSLSPKTTRLALEPSQTPLSIPPQSSSPSVSATNKEPPIGSSSPTTSPPAGPTPSAASSHNVYQDTAGVLKLDDELMAMLDFAFD